MAPLSLPLLRLICMHGLGLKSKPASPQKHLEATMAWLCRAHDVAGGTGVSSAFSFRYGWKPAYPETTGYIIPTFLDYWKTTGDAQYLDRAMRMGHWELAIQFPEGGVRGGQDPSSPPVVFNTGQVIFGWLALYEHTGRRCYLDAARKAGDWLMTVQDADGKWSTCSYGGIPHAYHTRVAWALLELYRSTSAEAYRAAAERNIGWALSLAQEGGWIDRMSFTGGSKAFTHTIAYTLRGLLECSDRVSPELGAKSLETVRQALSNIQAHGTGWHTPSGKPAVFLPGQFDRGWVPDRRSTCLTGNAQLALICLQMDSMAKSRGYRQLAQELLNGIMSTQYLCHPHPAIQGGVLGSYPIWGAYCPFNYPNWAAKFFADALMLRWPVS